MKIKPRKRGNNRIWRKLTLQALREEPDRAPKSVRD